MSLLSDSGTEIAASQALALPVAEQLQQLLVLEFEALKEQDLDRFEHLQTAKTDLLAELARLCPDSEVLQAHSDWQDLKEILVDCRDMHRRNAVLIERKLDAIRGALRSLSAGHASSPVEVYDRLGKMARFSKGRGFNEA
jgi:flagellar biosynthesis/type III secretory pathway chaperone